MARFPGAAGLPPHPREGAPAPEPVARLMRPTGH